jgi:hypothetical protein
MHGLIFKIKESHRQDQSESFVIYMYMHIQEICICISIFLFFITTSQMKSLHYDQCFIYIRIILIHIFVVSSRRNKTNPHHRNKFIPVLNATHLQAFKPKLSTYDQLYWKLINKMLVSIYLCMHKLKHFQPHSLLCHLWCSLTFMQFIRFYVIFIYMIIWKVDEAASTNFFFIIYNLFHIAIQL